jgi:hypothetical protein
MTDRRAIRPSLSIKNAARRQNLRQAKAKQKRQQQQTAKEPRVLRANLPMLGRSEKDAVRSHTRIDVEKSENLVFANTTRELMSPFKRGKLEFYLNFAI